MSGYEPFDKQLGNLLKSVVKTFIYIKLAKTPIFKS